MLRDVIEMVKHGADSDVPIADRSPNLNAAVLGLVADRAERARVRNLVPKGIERTTVSDPESFVADRSKNNAAIVVSLQFDESVCRRLIHRTLATSKHIQVALFGRQESVADTLPHDAHFQPPFDMEAAQQRMAHLYIRAYFSSTLEAFYQLNISETNYEMQATQESEKKSARLERIKRSRTLLESHLDEFTAYLDPEDIEELSYTRGDIQNSVVTLESRFDPRSLGLPPACPECGLDFGNYHGEGLGEGYEKIAAGTYRCTNCSHVINISESAQRFIL